ncbi:pyridoxamine 5'-phosphate oxidase family protein [uncultured Mucilaginibacter sp.]|uniref:pyridoxamine 5'-phosphate oxidase family protein n=1 Tax=uncultured Mucilaginibacter sp. TaxID=797541 RepID=UPI002623747E|nr:pyridoxamine 5'-phosphate oxidase family protein [uncultured Mucilaginibacter sp.]
MDSINANQEEDHLKSLAGTAALKKLKEIAEGTQTCFFCTQIKTGSPLAIRPMQVQKVDDEGNLWFLSSKDSHKNNEIQQDDHVHLLFQESHRSGFLNVYGDAYISEDKAKIEELWDPILKAWFTEGKDDPRISVVKVVPTEAYYWDNKHGDAIAFLKQTASAVVGKTFDDSVEGKLEI